MKLTCALLAAALTAFASAQSSPDFPIQVSQNLRVVYNDSNVDVTPGVLLPRSEVLSAPTAYLPSEAPTDLNYVLFLMDIDVDLNGSTVTLLHWFAPNLVAQPEALVRDNTTTDASSAVGAAYIPPTPPGGSGPHRYTFLLFEQPAMWAVPDAFFSINPPADTSARLNFSITDFVSQSGLGSPVAANYLRVLNGTAAETSSARTMTMAAPTATSSSGSQASGSSASSAVASASVSTTAASASASAASASASAMPTGGAMLVRSNGKEMLAGLAMAVVGAGAWMM